MTGVSFEFFPPRTADGANLLIKTVEELAQYQPIFQSVTYGAGGSNRDGTLQTVLDIAGKKVSPVASHLTFAGSKASDIKDFADALWDKGITSLVALRGDDREEGGQDEFVDTADFVKSLRDIHPFNIAVSCYPETHPKAHSREDDIQVLLNKQKAGASLAISQFFYDNSVFYDFVREARAAGVTLQIVPGILPIYNFERVKQMSEQCGASVPRFVHEAFEQGAELGSSAQEVASELLKAQVYDLAVAGFEEIHIYTLNRIELASLAARSFLDARELVQGHKTKNVA